MLRYAVEMPKNKAHISWGSENNLYYPDSQGGFALFLGLCAALRRMFQPLWLQDKKGYFS